MHRPLITYIWKQRVTLALPWGSVHQQSRLEGYTRVQGMSLRDVLKQAPLHIVSRCRRQLSAGSQLRLLFYRQELERSVCL